MNSENINIDEELDSLREFDTILPDVNFKIEIFGKLKKARNKNRAIVAGTLLLCVLLFNVISVVKLVSNHNIAERETNLTTVIISFSLDK